MKNIIIAIALLSTILGGYYIYSNNQKTTTTVSTANNIAPIRAPEVNGSVVSIEGNEIIVANELGRVILSDEEQAKKKAEMQKMSEDQRKAAREAENLQYKTENVTLTLPVGIPIVKGTGDGSGNIIATDLTSLTKGVYLTIWTSSTSEAEYVKIKGQ
jgi:hypothetical protein